MPTASYRARHDGSNIQPLRQSNLRNCKTKRFKFLYKNLQQKPQRSETHYKTEGRWADSSNETEQSHKKIKSAGQKVCTWEDKMLVDPYWSIRNPILNDNNNIIIIIIIIIITTIMIMGANFPHFEPMAELRRKQKSACKGALCLLTALHWFKHFCLRPTVWWFLWRKQKEERW